MPVAAALLWQSGCPIYPGYVAAAAAPTVTISELE